MKTVYYLHDVNLKKIGGSHLPSFDMGVSENRGP